MPLDCNQVRCRFDSCSQCGHSHGAFEQCEVKSEVMMLIGAVLVFMYILDRTHIIAWVRIPVGAFLLILGGLLLAMRFAIKKVMA